jgi:hypothetical protein
MLPVVLTARASDERESALWLRARRPARNRIRKCMVSPNGIVSLAGSRCAQRRRDKAKRPRVDDRARMRLGQYWDIRGFRGGGPMLGATGFLGALPRVDTHHLCGQRVTAIQAGLKNEKTGHFRSRQLQNAMNPRGSSNHVNVLFKSTAANMIARDRIRAINELRRKTHWRAVYPACKKIQPSSRLTVGDAASVALCDDAASVVYGPAIRASIVTIPPLAASQTRRIQWRLKFLTPNARSP